MAKGSQIPGRIGDAQSCRGPKREELNHLLLAMIGYWRPGLLFSEDRTCRAYSTRDCHGFLKDLLCVASAEETKGFQTKHMVCMLGRSRAHKDRYQDDRTAEKERCCDRRTGSSRRLATGGCSILFLYSGRVAYPTALVVARCTPKPSRSETSRTAIRESVSILLTAQLGALPLPWGWTTGPASVARVKM